MRRTLHSFLLFISLACSFSLVLGQGSTTATMNGQVTSEAGAELSSATVVAVHTPTGSKYGTLSNDEGFFFIPNMRIGGPYTVTVTYIGFKKSETKGIYLSLGQTYRQNIQLSDQNATLEEVVISASGGDVFDGNRTGAETYVGEEAIATLPSVSRDFLQDFVRLDPRASSTDQTGSNSGGISIAGVNNRYNAIYIDGAVNSDVFGLANSGTNGGQSGITPISPDAIEQVQVVLAPFDVKLGGFAGGGINAVTRSGTNTLEGSAYYFFRNENLAGKTPGDEIDDDARTQLAPFSAKTYGFRLGGPIIKNKLFFFTNVEIQRDEEPKPFSFNDYDGLGDAAKFTELTNYLSSTYGYDPGDYLNNLSTRKGEKFLAKLDWNINDNHNLTVRHSYVRGVEEDAPRSNSRQVYFRNSGVYFPSTTNSSALELKSVFSDNVFNDLTVGFTTVRDDRDILGASPFPQVQAQDGNATVIFGTDNFSYSNIVFQDVLTVTDNLTINKGKHTFTVGTHNEFFKIQNLFTIFSTPRYFYDNQLDSLGNVTQTGLDVFMSGAPGFALFGHELPTTPGDASGVRFGDEAENLGPTFHAMQLAFYAQDEYAISNNVKLTYGLRADIPIFSDDPPLNNTQFNTETIPLIEAFYDLRGAQASKAPGTSIMLSPRVGFNWDIKGDQSMQLRGGAGVFTSRVPWVWPGGMFIRNGLNSSFAGTFGPFSATPEEWRANLLNLNSPSGDVDLFVEDFKYPQIFRTSLGLDRKIGNGWIVTVEGIYTKTLNDVNLKNVNLKPSIGTLEGADNRPIFDANDPIDPTYARITLVDNTGKGFTTNVSAQIQKPFSNGWTASLAYSFTRAKALFDGFGFINSTNWRENSAINGRNSVEENDELTRTIFDAGTRVSSFVAKRFAYSDNAATTVSFFINGQSGQPYSYVYQNGEELQNEDDQPQVTMIYVPENQSDIVFADPATAGAQWAALNEFIENDSYLSNNRGQYMERNHARTPFETLIDMKIVQDFYVNAGGIKHNLQLSFDLFNVANFINPNWGSKYFVGNRGNYELIRFVGFEPGTNQPTFAFDAPTGEVWDRVNSGFRSNRWFSQVGVRYSF